eukprot:g10398.t1
MVLASRIALVSTAPHCNQSGPYLDILRAVSEATELQDGFALRPGENLGVHLGLIQEFMDNNDRVQMIAQTGGDDGATHSAAGGDEKELAEKLKLERASVHKATVDEDRKFAEQLQAK